MTMYLLLFYLSTHNDYSYSFTTSINELTDILQTNPDVANRALESLEEHDLIHYHNHNGEIHMTIIPLK